MSYNITNLRGEKQMSVNLQKNAKTHPWHFFLVLALSLSMLFSFVSPIFAKDEAQPELPAEANLMVSGFDIKPMFVYISRTATTISIGTYGETTATGTLIGVQGVTDEVWIYLYLERYVNGSWQVFNSWSKISYSYMATLQETDVVPHGYYYRVRGSYYAWCGNQYEHVNGYSATVYY
jgi:hypothetical protein